MSFSRTDCAAAGAAASKGRAKHSAASAREAAEAIFALGKGLSGTVRSKRRSPGTKQPPCQPPGPGSGPGTEAEGGRAGRDAAARRRASSILDELQGLQAELLGGRSDPSRLARLAALQSG